MNKYLALACLSVAILASGSATAGRSGRSGGLLGAAQEAWRDATSAVKRGAERLRKGASGLLETATKAARRIWGGVRRGVKRVVVKALGRDIAWKDTRAHKAALPSVDYMKRVGCPFSKWFSMLPKRFGRWERTLVDAYRDAWKRAGSPKGSHLNDHNYDTLLGQGNTHGFVAASVTIDNRRIPRRYRVGLFAKRRKHPAVVRFSDFGADASPLRLGRLAMKLPWATAWAKEINWLFTETLDTFPLANYEDLATFARDPQAAVLGKLKTAGHVAKSILGSGLPNMGQFGDGFLLGKTYYSQVPYALGQKAAMRFRLVSRNKSPSKVGRNEMRKGVQSFLAGRAAVFDLEIQIHPNAKDEAVTRRASSPWKGRAARYYRAGRLVIGRQATDAAGMSNVLRRALQRTLRPTKAQAKALHKLFYFHPILTSRAHRPLGEINSFRSHFYSQHAHARFRTMQSLLAKNRDRFRVPFAELMNDREVGALFRK